jgi:succinoglycan biosynthesis protein ExoL
MRTPARGIAYFAPDWTNVTVNKRATSLGALGFELVGFSFSRRRLNRAFQPQWRNIELGVVADRALAGRLVALSGALRRIVREREALHKVEFMVARNLDMALLALAAARIGGARAPLIYEVTDLHPTLTGKSFAGVVLRWLERIVLRHAEMLLVTSPAFITGYFQPRQGYHGRWFVLENKLFPTPGLPRERRVTPPALDAHAPHWVIGWFGALRCRKSLDMLTRIASALADRVTVYIRGVPVDIGNQIFRRAIAPHPNMSYGGEYRNPEDLGELYGRIHLNWCLDFSDEVNSSLLLPNRIYQGGYFGVPALALRAQHTGLTVEQRGLGWALPKATAESVTDFLKKLTVSEYGRMRQAVEAMPEQMFVDDGDLAELFAHL